MCRLAFGFASASCKIRECLLAQPPLWPGIIALRYGTLCRITRDENVGPLSQAEGPLFVRTSACAEWRIHRGEIMKTLFAIGLVVLILGPAGIPLYANHPIPDRNKDK
jgi:hypothetical protein